MSWWSFAGLHCEHLPTSILYGYIEQGQPNSMTIPAGNDMNTYTCYVSLTIVIEILLNYLCNFEIKICPKLPSTP